MSGKNTPPGPAVDASGQSVIDPTKNVLDLVGLQADHQNKMRRVELKAVRAEMHLEFAAMRRELKSFGNYIKDLSKAETKRIDATRKVDVGNVALANAAAETRASTLAGQVTAAKDAQVVALKSETDPLRKDIGDLRQSQWTIAGNREQQGETRSDTRAKSGNVGLWVGLGVAIFFGFLTFAATVFGTLVAAGVAIYIASRP